MKKEKVCYQFHRYTKGVILARREISFEIKLSSRLILDELCFNWNKNKLLDELNCSIEKGNKEKFIQLSNAYKHYIWE